MKNKKLISIMERYAKVVLTKNFSLKFAWRVCLKADF